MAVFILMTSYMFMLFLFLGSNSIVLMLLYLEVLSWLFVMLMSPSTVMKYLVMQAYFMILGLLGVLWMPLFLVLSLFLKIGLPPMHVWFLKLSVLMGKWVFIFFSTLHKLLPLLLLGSCFMTSYLLTSMILLVSTSLIYQMFEFLFIMMTSSMVHSGWMLLGIQLNLKTGLVYWTIYSLVFLFLLSTLSYNSMFSSGVEQSTNTGMAWLAVSGMPPFIMFWMKVWVLSMMVWVSFNLSLLLVFTSVMALSSYFRAFHVSLSLTYYSSPFITLFLSIFFICLI